jgi:transposase InsO family protein
MKKCSQGQACRFLGLSRSTARYPARPVRADEALLVERLQQFAKKRRRRGYRLAHRELRHSGVVVNHPPKGHPECIVYGNEKS